MNRRSLLLVPCLLAACSQPPSPAGEASPASSPLNLVAAAAPSPATTASSSHWEDDQDTVPPEKFTESARNFEEAKKALLEGYYDTGITEDDLYRAAVAGMLQRVDPKMRKWNRLLAPSEIAELRNDLKGEIVGVGIGIELDPATGYIDVRRVYPGSPADRAGVAPPDKIVTVNGRLYRGLSLHDAVADIRGKAGETVTLSILRGDKLVSVPLVREKVVFDRVSHMIVGGDAGYVAIPGFNAKTAQELHDALTDLASKGARSLVLDLRHSPGGSFDDAVAAVGELVPAGSTVVTLKKRGTVEPIVPKTAPVEVSQPVAVLVDHETASSAELVTAALQELRHATVIGSKTQGKWTVQRVDDLPNGYAIKYTMALFASPAGRSFEGVGMAPDIEVDQTDDATMKSQTEPDPVKRLAEDVQMRTAVAVLGKGR
ncbi:MAG TPA: S41 family peptidase [Polyangiaceae bacterium]|jgi:carboxyl-terminal processing protease|nr:S41 family peptidase [Polyangiaceae bacterium]